ncbi:MAG: anaerobic sulfite reductase subunit AsrA [Clostridium sp.]
MKIRMSVNQFDETMKNINDKYKMFAPITIPYRGQYSDTDVVRYEEVTSIKEIEFGKKSHFTGKEAVMPVTETLFFYTEDECKVPKIDEREILLFLRSCDVHGLSRIDDVYLRNGNEPDFYYKRLRDKVRIVVMGCEESFRNCFCVSMGTNTPSDYSIGIKVENDDVYLDVLDKEFQDIFVGEKAEFDIPFVKSNGVKVDIPDELDTLEVSQYDFWREYDSRCIACGRCNFSCPTCSCFTMQDIVSQDNVRIGERRRIGASCQVPGFSLMAGGHEVRKQNGDRMRYRTMHKMYDHKKRFGRQMCVGCGRCDDVCPQYISISAAMNRVTEIVNSKRGGK